ncbi:MAG: UbiD family decarboxylase [Phycisphaerae bacterium]|nr:UbiD family decarboxylase [Phycisphaerae bacterium]
MAYNNLREFVVALARAGQLVRVAAAVDVRLELAEVAARVMKEPSPEGLAGAPASDPLNGRLGGRALLFENVHCDGRRCELPVLVNVWGSYRRMCMALGCDDFDELAARVNALVRPEVPQGFFAKVRKLPELARLASLGPRVRASPPPCQEVVCVGEAVDLSALPVIQCWPDDGAGHPAGEIARRYITLGCTMTKHPDTHARNMGIYRVQLLGPRRAAMHIHPPHDGAENWRAWTSRGLPMPAAIVFGGEPAVTYAASAPCPPGLDELLLAGFLQGRAIELAPCLTQPLEVPAQAELVIEGQVAHDETTIEGPFGDHTGFYSAAGEFPVFRATAITRRRDAIYPTTVVGYPPMEDYYFGKATERIFLPALRMLVPEVLDYDLPLAGAFHNFVFVRIRKAYAGQARKVMHAIWGAGQLACSKIVVVVDESVNVHDPNDVWFAVGANVDVRRDLEHAEGPLDILDHAGEAVGTGAKLGIDATRKLPGEGPTRDWPRPLRMTEEIRRQVDRRWEELFDCKKTEQDYTD